MNQESLIHLLRAAVHLHHQAAAVPLHQIRAEVSQRERKKRRETKDRKREAIQKAVDEEVAKNNRDSARATVEVSIDNAAQAKGTVRQEKIVTREVTVEETIEATVATGEEVRSEKDGGRIITIMEGRGM